MNAVDTATPTYDLTVPATLTIATPEDYAAYGERLKTIAAFRKRVEAFFAGMKSKALAAHREVCAKEKEALRPALDHEARIRRALVVYNDAIERQRREERIELERQERLRVQDERLALAVTLDEEATATGDASLRDAAEHMLSAPINVAPVQPYTPPAPKVDGLSFRATYEAEVVDLLVLVKAVAAGQQPITLLLPNAPALNGLARSLKEGFAVPGVRLLKDKTPVTRTA